MKPGTCKQKESTIAGMLARTSGEIWLHRLKESRHCLYISSETSWLLKKILGNVSVILQKSAQCGFSDFSRGFAVKCFGSDSWQIFTSFIGNFQSHSENIYIQGVEKVCFQILKGKRIILKSPLYLYTKK